MNFDPLGELSGKVTTLINYINTTNFINKAAAPALKPTAVTLYTFRSSSDTYRTSMALHNNISMMNEKNSRRCNL